VLFDFRTRHADLHHGGVNPMSLDRSFRELLGSSTVHEEEKVEIPIAHVT